ncbi:MAG: cellulose biosynthesis cyclic di-GMP-binding regulatory protein BcsB [Chloroflexi bacterium]|nr:cellulose biosynthesis cyclic di-GMP-binding regulatory protein BcsB [Chloroflexota bacterium]
MRRHLLRPLLLAVLASLLVQVAHADPPSPMITTLADGSSQFVLGLTTPGAPNIVYLKLPADWTVASAFLDVASSPNPVKNVAVDVGDDGTREWTNQGELKGTKTAGDLAPAIVEYLKGRRPIASGPDIILPLAFYADSPGPITISNIKIARKVASTPEVLQPEAASLKSPDSLKTSEPAKPAEVKVQPSKPAPSPDITLKSLGYGDTTVKGIQRSLDLAFPGPGGYPVGDKNYLTLVFSHSDLLVASLSTMTVQLNGVLVGGFRLTPENARHGEVKVELPRERMLDTINRVKLLVQMRVTEGACADDWGNPAASLTILGDSAIHYDYASATPTRPSLQPELSEYPSPFVRPALPWPDEVYFVLPASPSANEFTVAASIAAKLGQMARSKQVRTRMAMTGQMDPEVRERASLIFVGKAESLALPQEVRDAAGLEVVKGKDGVVGLSSRGQRLGAEEGLLQEITSPWNNRNAALIVTGATEQAVRRAGMMLAARTYMGALNGARVVVKDDPQPPQPAVERRRDGSQEITFAQSGLSDTTLSGPGELSGPTVNFGAPASNPAGTAYLDLALAHSPLISSAMSSLRLDLNGQPIQSVPLDDSNVGPTIVRVPLPAIVLRPGQNGLSVRATLQGKGGPCEQIDSSSGWVTIYSKSLIHLPPPGPSAQLDLSLLPFPFLSSRVMSGAAQPGTTLILPDDPSQWQEALQMAFELGRRSTGDLVILPAMPISQLDETTRSRSDLIFYGPWEANPVFRLPEALPALRADEGGVAFKRRLETLIAMDSEPQIGAVEIMPSPWNKERALLVISGSSPETIAWASAAIGKGGLKGNLATIAQTNRVVSFDIVGEERPQEARSVPLPEAATGIVGLMVIVSLVLVVLRSRARGQSRG